APVPAHLDRDLLLRVQHYCVCGRSLCLRPRKVVLLLEEPQCALALGHELLVARLRVRHTGAPVSRPTEQISASARTAAAYYVDGSMGAGAGAAGSWCSRAAYPPAAMDAKAERIRRLRRTAAVWWVCFFALVLATLVALAARSDVRTTIA